MTGVVEVTFVRVYIGGSVLNMVVTISIFAQKVSVTVI